VTTSNLTCTKIVNYAPILVANVGHDA